MYLSYSHTNNNNFVIKMVKMTDCCKLQLKFQPFIRIFVIFFMKVLSIHFDVEVCSVTPDENVMQI